VGAAIEAKVSNNTGCSNTALRNFCHTLRSCGGSLKVDRLVTLGVIDMRGTARFISLCNSIRQKGALSHPCSSAPLRHPLCTLAEGPVHAEQRRFQLHYQLSVQNKQRATPFKKVYWFIMADRLGPEANRFSHLSLRCDAFRNVRICWFPAR
jgi:hypothetical protein